MPQFKIPRYYVPRPQQAEAWSRMLSGDYDYYFKIWHRQCIAGDTLVWTEDGLVPMSGLRVGDLVWSARIDGNVIEYQLKPVTAIWRTDPKPVIKMQKGDHIVRASYDHPVHHEGSYR